MTGTVRSGRVADSDVGARFLPPSSEQIEAIKGSVLLARILREQQSRLPQVDVRKDLKEEIADLRLKQFELNKVREQLADIPGYLDSHVLGEAAALERPGGNTDVSQVSAELRQALESDRGAVRVEVDDLAAPRHRGDIGVVLLGECDVAFVRADDRFLVQGLDDDPAKVERALDMVSLD